MFNTALFGLAVHHMQQKTHPNSIAGLFKKEPRTGLWARECYGGGLLAPGLGWLGWWS